MKLAKHLKEKAKLKDQNVTQKLMMQKVQTETLKML